MNNEQRQLKQIETRDSAIEVIEDKKKRERKKKK